MSSTRALVLAAGVLLAAACTKDPGLVAVPGEKAPVPLARQTGSPPPGATSIAFEVPAGVVADAGSVPDAASRLDAGALPDAAVPPDAGSPPDAAQPPYPRTYLRTLPAAPDAIAAENALPGESCGLTTPADVSELAAFAYADSVEAGDTLEVAVHSSMRDALGWELFRVGWYGGAGARRVASGANVVVGPRGPCDVEPTTMRVDCAWAPDFRIAVDAAWRSGLYVVRLTRASDGKQSYVPFTVRDHRRADVALLWHVTTEQAYNGFQGESLYQDDSGTMPASKAWAVSLNRPIEPGFGAGLMLYQQAPLARFLERHGYDVTYGTGVDVALRPGFLDGVRALALGGHDEYWAQANRDEVDYLVARGGSVFNLGANTGYWRVRFEPDARGQLRTMVSYKEEQRKDPLGFGATGLFRDVSQPEERLFGNGYVGWVMTFFALAPVDPSSWLFAGTGMGAGDAIHGVGYNELDSVNVRAFAPANLEVLARTPGFVSEGGPVTGQTVAWATPAGGLVFSAGSIYWPVMLGTSADWNDKRVERMTWNVLERALATGKPPPGNVAPPPATVDPRWADEVTTVAGAERGFLDGPIATAKFDGPSGVAVGPDGTLYVADTNNHRVRAIDRASGTVRTVAGAGWAGATNGAGASATFNQPQALALGPDGALYVADTGNHLMRRVRLGAGVTVETVAGVAHSPGRTDGGLTSARFQSPRGLAFAGDGALLVADTLNCTVRRVDLAAGQVSTLAGAGCGMADGSLAQARLRYPTSVGAAADGSVYVVDSGNQRLVRILDGTVTTVAGGRNGYKDGTGSAARMRPYGGILPAGRFVLFADTGNARLRKLSPGADAASSGLYTVAFDGRLLSDDGPASAASVVLPAGMAMDGDHVLYLADPGAHRVRAVTFPPTFFQ